MYVCIVYICVPGMALVVNYDFPVKEDKSASFDMYQVQCDKLWRVRLCVSALHTNTHAHTQTNTNTHKRERETHAHACTCTCTNIYTTHISVSHLPTGNHPLYSKSNVPVYLTGCGGTLCSWTASHRPVWPVRSPRLRVHVHSHAQVCRQHTLIHSPPSCLTYPSPLGGLLCVLSQ